MEAAMTFVIAMLGAIGGGVSAYIAIRTDLASIKAQISIMEKSIDRSHARIDDLYSK